MYNMIMK